MSAVGASRVTRAADCTNAPICVDFTVTLTEIVSSEPDVGGYSASIPALPGCHTQGETLDEIRATSARLPRAGWPSPTTKHSPVMRWECREGYFRRADVSGA